MIQVKEFDCSIEDEMNKWLKENDKNIIVKDIKYQIGINENQIKGFVENKLKMKCNMYTIYNMKKNMGE